MADVQQKTRTSKLAIIAFSLPAVIILILILVPLFIHSITFTEMMLMLILISPFNQIIFIINIISVVLSIKALRDIKKNNLEGKLLAIWGLILSILMYILPILLIILGLIFQIKVGWFGLS